MANFHKEKKVALIRDLAAKFLGEQSNRSSLITVTKATLSLDGKELVIGISVLPDDHAEAALDFTRRHLGDLRQYLGKQARFGQVPYLSAELDMGEKNRQRVDELLAEDVRGSE